MDNSKSDMISKLIADTYGEQEPTDYVEEMVDMAGHHMRKEVHQGQGFKTIEISSDEPLDDNDIA